MKRLNFNIDDETYRAFNHTCVDKGVPMSMVLRVYVESVAAEYKLRGGSVNGWITGADGKKRKVKA